MILNVGFLNAEFIIDQLNLISRTLTNKYLHKVALWVKDFWAKIVAGNHKVKIK